MVAELKALQSALLFCYEAGYKNVRVYSDSSLNVRAVMGQQRFLDYAGTTTEDIQRLWRSGYFVDIQHVSRRCHKGG